MNHFWQSAEKSDDRFDSDLGSVQVFIGALSVRCTPFTKGKPLQREKIEKRGKTAKSRHKITTSAACFYWLILSQDFVGHPLDVS